MNNKQNVWMDDVFEKARERAGDLEPWPYYFESKIREFKIILNFCKISDLVSSLEIGCGNGFTASILAGRAKKVVAFDLPRKDTITHSMGIDIAKEFIRRMDIRNINIIGGSVEELPFPDNSFDFILTGYALQYVARKEKALKEICRVLHPNGFLVAIVPNFMERLVVPLIKLEYILKKLLSGIVNQGVNTTTLQQLHISKDLNTRKTTYLNRVLNDWLLLKPDGAYKSYFDEMLSHTPGSWRKLFEKSGFKIARIFSTEILPLGIFDILGDPARRFVSNKSHILSKTFGSIPVIRELGYSLCLVSVKG